MGHCEGALSFAAGECKWRCLCQHAGSHYKLISHVTKSTACSSMEGQWRRRTRAGWGQDEGNIGNSSSRLYCQLTSCQSYDIQLGKVVAFWWANVPYNMLHLPQLLPVYPNYTSCPSLPPLHPAQFNLLLCWLLILWGASSMMLMLLRLLLHADETVA